jgi:hypothetical protein
MKTDLPETKFTSISDKNENHTTEHLKNHTTEQLQNHTTEQLQNCKGWHVSYIWEDTYMPVSSHEEVRLGPIKLV